MKWFAVLLAWCLLCVAVHAQNTPATYSLNTIYTPLEKGVSGDFNGDGKPDYAFGCAASTQVITYFGRGDGFPAQYPTPLPSVCTSQELPLASGTGDFNHDGKADVAFLYNASYYPSGYSEPGVSVLGVSYALGNGDGTFQATQQLAFPNLPGPQISDNPIPPAIPVSLHVADFNNDGYSDILVVDNNGDLIVYLANKNGGFSSPVITSLPIFSTYFSIGDVNKDGYPDLVYATSDDVSGVVTVALGNGDGSFRQKSDAIHSSDSENPGDPGQLADLNGDGNLDVLGFDPNSESYVLFAGDGTGNFQAPVVALSTPAGMLVDGFNPTETLLDIDQDGVPDLVFFGVNPTSTTPYLDVGLFWAKGNGNGTFEQPALLVDMGDMTGAILQTINLENGGNPAILDSVGDLYLPTQSTAAIKLGGFQQGLYGYDFNLGVLDPGQAVTASMQMSSGGTGTLDISSIQAQSPFQENDNCLGALSTGTCQMTASSPLGSSFAPGAYSGNIAISSNASGAPLQVPAFFLIPAPLTAEFTASPQSLDFGTQQIGTNTMLQVTFTSVSGQPATVASVNPPEGAFSMSTACRGQVTTCVADVTFTPQAEGGQSGVVELIGGNGVATTVTLTGTGSSTGPMATAMPSFLAFGSQPVGTTSTAQTVTLSYTGTAALQIQSVTAPTGFAVTDNCGTSLASGANCTLLVTFAPSVAGSQSGTLSISDNATGSPQTVALSGTGVAASAPVAQLSVTPSSLSFNSFAGSSSSTQTVTVANTGTAAAQIQSVVATAGFNISNMCGSMLAADSSCTIGISFAPSALGTQTGSLTIQDNAPGSPQTISLSGTNSDFSLSASSGSSTSATISSGQTATYLLTLTPAGGFSGTLTASCTGAPAGMQCIGSPATISLTGNTPQNITFTVGPVTTAQSFSLKSLGAGGVVAFALFFGLFPVSFRKFSRRLNLLMIFALSSVLLAISACGGSATTVVRNQSTTYTLTATFTTATGQQVQQNLVLIVTGSSQ